LLSRAISAGVSEFALFWGDMILHVGFYLSALAVISFDAMVPLRRRIKLIMVTVWIINACFTLYQLSFVFPERDYFQNFRMCVPLSSAASFHVSLDSTSSPSSPPSSSSSSASLNFGPHGNDEGVGAIGECFSVVIVRLQTIVALTLFCCKHAYSLLKHPHALVMLRSSISYRPVE
jgi:hypothetical protein